MAGFGAFGKIPSLGDFFRINVSSDFVRPWDHWLQLRLNAVRNSLGDRWQTCYMSAPIWRFSLSGDLAGKNAALGVMMPSVDRVGREFPLTLVAPMPPAIPVAELHQSATKLFEELELIALDALEDDMSTELLKERLSDMAPVEPLLQSSANQRNAAAKEGSMWSANLDGQAHVLRCATLPTEGEMVGLFDLNAAIWKTNNQLMGAQL